MKTNNWTEEQITDLREKYLYYLDHKEEAEEKFKRKWNNIYNKARMLSITSMKINKKCTTFLGCHVAEKLLSYIFKDVKKMPYGNPGYDFICNKGYKIDVKSSTLHKNKYYTFSIKKNKIADYFLCIGFNNIDDLEPQKLWLIKGELCNEIVSLTITNTENDLESFKDYELPLKLKEAINCCELLKRKETQLTSEEQLKLIENKKKFEIVNFNFKIDNKKLDKLEIQYTNIVRMITDRRFYKDDYIKIIEEQKVEIENRVLNTDYMKLIEDEAKELNKLIQRKETYKSKSCIDQIEDVIELSMNQIIKLDKLNDFKERLEKCIYYLD
jgi:hypothetical protein